MSALRDCSSGFSFTSDLSRFCSCTASVHSDVRRLPPVSVFLWSLYRAHEHVNRLVERRRQSFAQLQCRTMLLSFLESTGILRPAYAQRLFAFRSYPNNRCSAGNAFVYALVDAVQSLRGVGRLACYLTAYFDVSVAGYFTRASCRPLRWGHSAA